MKKIIFSSLIIIASALFLTLACKKDKAKEETVSPAPTQSTTAASNSTLNVSGSCWTFNTCAANRDSLIGVCGTTTVMAIFGTPPPIGICTYTVTAGTPSANQMKITVINAPGQPVGVLWHSGFGIVSVNSNTITTTATFSNIPCMQYTSTTSTVNISGTLSCL